MPRGELYGIDAAGQCRQVDLRMAAVEAVVSHLLSVGGIDSEAHGSLKAGSIGTPLYREAAL